ncbi:MULTISPECIES: IS256 family transposase [Protofrankia]|uniref:Mutator family transposase n=3 Tax=Candidatus Protofrankia datiscae TaxID=2716812 RepID=F8B518_9ACTN|nr:MULTISPECIES: IS256 family transposase [Protofrankia]AEH07706.1 transposase mutator type [Candidatus Protofrankia datiscae]AEH10692.1 transposase mutator type [Candidatus Protofrankia datiscae]AEH11040.1 transposase mutator type [Candidatus Protofrankia datiscae]
MTDTIEDTPADTGPAPAPPVMVDEALAESLIERARVEGLSLTGPGGMLAGLTKMVLEKALAAEMTAHLGYEPGDPAGRNGGNSRNGTRTKTVVTEIGPVAVDVPRDRDGSFTPQLVAKRQRRLGGVEELVVSLVAKGLTTGEVQAHLAEVYGTEVSRQTISTITDSVIAGMEEWRNRPLDPVYAVVFIDAIVVKIRDGQVANRPVYVAIGVTADGERDVLGLWAGTGGEGAKHWQQVLTELKNRGVTDVLILVCDGLTGLPDAVAQVWPVTIVQTCIVHLLRNSFRYASKKDWPALAKDLKPVYTAPTEAAALDRFTDFAATWEKKYPAIIRLWENAWAEFVPFLRFDAEIRTVICTTNAIESLNARFRRSVKARGHFPNEQAALKHLYLTLTSLDPTGRGRAKWMIRWKAPLNAFDLAFDGRLSAGRK